MCVIVAGRPPLSEIRPPPDVGALDVRSAVRRVGLPDACQQCDTSPDGYPVRVGAPARMRDSVLQQSGSRSEPAVMARRDHFTNEDGPQSAERGSRSRYPRGRPRSDSIRSTRLCRDLFRSSEDLRRTFSSVARRIAPVWIGLARGCTKLAPYVDQGSIFCILIATLLPPSCGVRPVTSWSGMRTAPSACQVGQQLACG
jgi:hypothetical protein